MTATRTNVCDSITNGAPFSSIFAVVATPPTDTDAVLYDYFRNPQSITRNESDASLMRRAESLIEVVDQLRELNERVPMSVETRALLSAELVGQGLQVDHLRQHLTDAAMRKRLDDRLKRTNFWRALWKDATRFTRKRQLAQVMLRESVRR